MTLFYAASEQGDHKAANAARKLAYTETKEQDKPKNNQTAKTEITPDFFGEALKRFKKLADVQNDDFNCKVNLTTAPVNSKSTVAINNSSDVSISNNQNNSEITKNAQATKTKFIIDPYLELGKPISSYLQRYDYEKNSTLKNSLITLPDEVNLNTVYYGNIHGRETAEDMISSDKKRTDITDISWFTALDFIPSEEQHLSSFRNMSRFLTKGKMQEVLEDMISHFADGTGTQYRNAILTETVKSNKTTQAFMKDFSNVFDSFMKKYNGEFSLFAHTKEFRDALVKNKVLLSTYDYGYDNLQNGLMLAVHSWTKSRVDVKNLKIMENGTYSCTLEFTFSDNFGLDEEDIEKFGALPGFRSWYILQHYDGFANRYKPFETVVTIDYNITGSLSEEK